MIYGISKGLPTQQDSCLMVDLFCFSGEGVGVLGAGIVFSDFTGHQLIIMFE